MIGHHRRYRPRGHFDPDGPYLPTPSEIDQAAAAIRATWSPEERRNREAMPSQPAVKVPQLDLREVFGKADSRE